MADITGSDVFISYKRRKRAEIDQIASALRALNVTVWFDERLEAGSSFSEEINRNIANAKSVLVCWTNDCFEHGGDRAGWVRSEAQLARDRQIHVPVFLEPTQLGAPFNIDHTIDLAPCLASGAALSVDACPAWTMVLTALAAKLERPGLPLYAKVLAGTDTAALAAAVQAFPNDPLAATAREKIAKEAERINQEANRVRASLDAITPAQAPEPPPQRKPIWPFLVAAGVLAAVGLVGVLIAIGALRLPFSAPIAAIESNGQAAAPIAAPAPVPEDVAAWTGLNQANRDDLRAFLNRYPASIHAEAAKSALAGIALSELEAAQTLNAPAALASWAQAWPDQPQAAVAAAQAQKRRAELSSPAYKSWSGEVPDCVASPLKIAFVNGQISSESAYRAALEGLVRNARRCALDYVLLEGHARFGAGTVERLAASRAMVTQVRDLLIEQGVPRGLIRERGYGDTRYLPASAAPTVDPGDRVEVSVVFVEEGK